jgi:RecB family exonuclease
LSSHLLADFRRCPLLYYRKRLGLVPDEDRPAYLLGHAAHTLILERLKRCVSTDVWPTGYEECRVFDSI